MPPPFDLDDPRLLFRDDVLADPAALYAHLRTNAPVWAIPGAGACIVTTSALVAEAVGRTDDFSSNLRGLIYTGDDGLPAVFDMSEMGDAAHVLATADPPEHTAHRKVMQPLFSPAAVERLAAYVDEAAAALVATVVDVGGGDVATAIAEPLPVQVICRMVGIPDADVETLAPLVLQSNDLLAGVLDGASMGASAGAAMQASAYLVDLLDHWTPTPEGTSVCDVLARAIADGETTTASAQGMLVQLLGAGTETTTSLIGRAVLQLAEDPELQRTVRSQPDLVPTFLEEVLRLDGPFRFHYRSVPRDTELGGVRLPAGSMALLMWASANLDEAGVDRPDELRLDRPTPKQHFAFGRGIHFCIGAPLARLEARRTIEHLLSATTDIALDPDHPPAYRPSIFLRRLGTLPIQVSRV